MTGCPHRPNCSEEQTIIHGVPSYHDYIRDKGGPIGCCLACGFQGAMVNGVTGYECPTCGAMRLEFCLRDGRVYCQFQPTESILPSCDKTPQVPMHAA
jgi:predicted RNA-binding Zn-ribbon protein involved in translation (DUF1610 family)